MKNHTSNLDAWFQKRLTSEDFKNQTLCRKCKYGKLFQGNNSEKKPIMYCDYIGETGCSRNCSVTDDHCDRFVERKGKRQVSSSFNQARRRIPKNDV